MDKFIVIVKGTVKKGRGMNKEYDEITILNFLVLHKIKVIKRIVHSRCSFELLRLKAIMS